MLSQLQRCSLDTILRRRRNVDWGLKETRGLHWRDCSICSSVLETQFSSFFLSDHIAIHNQFPSNQELSFVARQPFPSPMRTSSRPWCRPVFTQLQRRGLEKRFQVTKYVTKRERLQIGAMLGLSETQVKVWFQNRRTKWRHEAAKKEEKEKEEARKKAKEEQREELVNLREEEKKDDDSLNVGASGNKKPLSTLKKDWNSQKKIKIIEWKFCNARRNNFSYFLF